VFHPDQPDELLQLVWYDRSAEPLGTLGEPAAYEELRFAPDGTRLAAAIQDPDTGNEDIWIHDLVRDVRTRFTLDPARDKSPVYSSDGEHVYFASNRRGRFDLYRKALAGPDPEELVLESPEDKFPMYCPPDGRTLAFTQGEDLWVMPIDPPGDPRLLIASAFGADCSRDGRWLTYVSAAAGRPEVYLTSLPEPGRVWQVSPRGSFAAGWQGPTRLFYVDLDGAVWSANVAPRGAHDVDIGKPELYIAAPNRIQNGASHPDGERSLLAERQGERIARSLTLVLRWPEIGPPRR
jgi:dipeptidyl aminopeptidase/acylaminoacyl peptidase